MTRPSWRSGAISSRGPAGSPDSDSPVTRVALLRRALLLSVLSILLAGATGVLAVVVGLASGSLSLLGFGFDAAIDSAASVALVWRFRIEAREPHRAERVETIAEAVVGVVLLVLAAYLGYGAVRALVDSTHPEASPVGIGLLLFSLVVLPPLAYAKHRTAAALSSGALRADSILTGIAALLALISLAGLGLSTAFGMTSADAVGALVVVVILFREGWSSLRATRTGDAI
jgi:divalent metal cation (Fe/Co/Zn/Cd) transporter